MSQEAKRGDIVAVHYTGTLDSGEVFDSSRDREPLEFEVGGGQVIPGFDQAVEGLVVGENREVRLEPEQAYGEPREDLIVEVARSRFPDDSEPQLGQQIRVQVAPDQNHVARITDVAEDRITLDLNHPLAGHALNFDVQLVEIR